MSYSFFDELIAAGILLLSILFSLSATYAAWYVSEFFWVAVLSWFTTLFCVWKLRRIQNHQEKKNIGEE